MGEVRRASGWRWSVWKVVDVATSQVGGVVGSPFQVRLALAAKRLPKFKCRTAL